MLAPTWGSHIESRSFRVVLHQNIAAKIHRTEMDSEVHMLKRRKLLDNTNSEKLQIVRV